MEVDDIGDGKLAPMVGRVVGAVMEGARVFCMRVGSGAIDTGALVAWTGIGVGALVMEGASVFCTGAGSGAIDEGVLVA